MNRKSISISEAAAIEDIWDAVCTGDLNSVKSWVKNSATANKRWDAFGGKHSLIMGAARNDEVEVVSYLIKVGGTIEPNETEEFAKFVKKSGGKLSL